MPRLQAMALQALASRIFEALGAPAEEASWVAELLVRANLAGHDSHGIIQIPAYAQAVRSGLIRPGTPSEIIDTAPAMAMIDGHWGFGQVVVRRAMELAMEKARKTQISLVGAYNLYHLGRLADYTALAAAQDLAAIMTVNGGGAARWVAPFGGTAGRLATNPISIAFPTGGAVPFVLDMATSAVAEGKVRLQRQRGEPVPEGWLLDAQGHPSTDPNTLYGEPPGALLPLGEQAGHKGFGLALVVEILSGILARGGYAQEGEARFANGACIMVIDIAAFVEPHDFRAQIDALLAYVKSAPTAPGGTAIMYPGEPEALEQQRRAREGIVVEEATWQQIVTLAQALGVAAPEASERYS